MNNAKSRNKKEYYEKLLDMAEKGEYAFFKEMDCEELRRIALLFAELWRGANEVNEMLAMALMKRLKSEGDNGKR